MEIFICRYCASKRKNLRSLSQHERLCPNNLDRKLSSGMTGKKGSNKWIYAKDHGLPKPKLSDESLKKMSIASSKRRHSAETRKKISESRIAFLKANPEMVPYKLNHYSKGQSYPEKYWQTILDDSDIRYEAEYQIGLYSLDFAFHDSMIDLEIDGEQHYVDPRIVDSDNRRTKYLEDQGWTIVRVRWSHYKKLSKSDRTKYVSEIMTLLGP